MRALLLSALGFAAFGPCVVGADQMIPLGAASSAVAFSRDGKSLIVGTTDGKVRVWDLASGRFGQSFAPEKGDLRPIVLAVPGHFATPSTNGAVKVWEARSGRVVANFTLWSTGFPRNHTLVSSADGALLAGSGTDPTLLSANIVRVVDSAGLALFESTAGLGGLPSLAFSPDSSTLVGASFDTNIRVWDVRSGQLKHVIDEMPLSMFDMAFSPDGKHLATGGADRILYLWDTTSWKIARKMKGQPEPISRICFSPDGTQLVTGGLNDVDNASPVIVVLWDVASGRQLHTWNAEHRVRGVSFSPDGRRVAIADGSNNLKLWDVPIK